MSDLILGAIAYLLCGVLVVLVGARSDHWDLASFARESWFATALWWPIVLAAYVVDKAMEWGGPSRWLTEYGERNNIPRPRP